MRKDVCLLTELEQIVNVIYSVPKCIWIPYVIGLLKKLKQVVAIYCIYIHTCILHTSAMKSP